MYNIHDINEASDRKRKATDFYHNASMKKQMSKKSMQIPPGEMLNMFYSRENECKLCAEGAIRACPNLPPDSLPKMDNFSWMFFEVE